jgi:alpha-tubulin suppressor-like RCC1 family protein
VVEVTASWAPSSNIPVPLATKFDAVDVSSQDSHVLALARDGSVYAWGKGDTGQLGIGPLPIIKFKTHTPSAMTYVPFPVRIPNLTDVAAISAGREHSLALLKDGTVRGWGSNKLGEVGDGTTIDRDRPVPVQGVRNAVALATGGNGFSAALLGDGTVMTWGSTANGALGRAPWVGDSTPSPTPALVPGVQGIRAIGAGLRHMIALTETGTIISWGDDTYGNLGRDNNRTNVPGVIKSLTGVQSIFTINSVCFAVLASGRIMNWGGGVRPWTRPGGGMDWISRSPILLWLDGLDQP